MQRKIRIAFFLFQLLFFLYFVFLLFNMQLDIKYRERTEGFQSLTEFQVQAFQDEEAPLGIIMEYSFVPDVIEDSYRTLMFYTIHQNVRVYVENECIYSMEPAASNLWGKTSGSVWNEVTLSDTYSGKNIRIQILPVYKNVTDVVPVTYYGCKSDIVSYVIVHNLPVMLLSLAAILSGVFFILFAVYNYKNTEVDKGLMMLGLFAVQIGMWKLTDSIAINLILGNHLAVSMMPFMALMLIIIPITSFLRELHSTRNSWIWNIPCIASIADMSLVLVLQVLRIADMRQLLTLTHINMLLVVVITIGMVVHEVATVGWNSKLKRNILCMCLCFLGAVLDMGTFYFSDGQNMYVLGMVSFMIYIIVFGVTSMQEAKQLMNIGMRARKYEEMAYHDQLTGLLNRTAYAEHIKEEEFNPEHCIVVMCDLNDLKKCNDTLGHEKGDLYIKSCAEMIKKCFEDKGRCYRIGGDEFCILLSGCSLAECRRKTEQLKKCVETYNREYGEIHMGIACGYELYDKRLDYDIGDTARRADRMMYHEKFTMKQQAE